MSEIQDLKMESFQRLCELCAELKLKSPHPSRPHIPKAVEPTTLSSIHYLFECIFAKETQNIASEDEQATFIAKKSNALCDLCTFVRNAAAMDHENQHAIDSSNITTDVRKTIFAMIAHELVHPEAMKCATIAGQALSNIVTRNQKLQRKLLEQELIPGSSDNKTVFWQLLASAHRKTNLAGLVLVLNSINGDPELVRLICTASSGQQVVRMFGTLFGNIQDDESEEKEVVYTVLSRIIESGYFYTLVEADRTLEMYGLYESLAVYCRAHLDKADLISSVFDKKLVFSISSSFAQIHDVLSSLWQVAAPGNPEFGKSLDMESAMAAHRCLCALLSILETATASHNQKLADLAIDCKLAHRIVELLGLLNINLPRIQRLSTRSSTATEERQQQDKEEGQTKSIERLFMLKCDLIQIIGNISYKHKAIQDLMRELDGLSLVLDNMRIDENHPFIKEYAIVALKWLLDNNKESHEYVKNMEASKPMLDPSIAASGFQMDVDDKGKISVKKADKQ
ncbi:Ataxin-10 [Coemansia sp. RSA 986]|nr:Ataxin-10 [Coemansia sp. RSA 986]